MLRTGQLHRAPPRPRALARRRECCYRGPWRLPGPDSHRLAAVSLSLGYVVAPSFRWSSAPELLDAHSAGIAIRTSDAGDPEGHVGVQAVTVVGVRASGRGPPLGLVGRLDPQQASVDP